MASALYVPTVAIFGSTDSTATGPFGDGHKVVSKGVPCAPCLERECPKGHLRCMTEITADEVFNALQEILPTEKAVFLDKDGTLIEDKNYLNSFDDMEILPDSGESLRKLKEGGFKLIGITNQSGIARGLVDEFFVRESNAYIQNKLNIDDFYYCHHHPDEKCHCRKPEPLMLLKAGAKHHIDFKSSYMIGDKESDVLVSKKTGVTGILISETPIEKTSASYVAKNLKNAAEWILENESTMKND
jgi:heptosyltransferase-2